MLEQLKGQVVDHLPATILRRAGHRRLAGTRNPRDQQYPFRGGAVFHSYSSPNWARASSTFTGADGSSPLRPITGTLMPATTRGSCISGSRSTSRSRSTASETGMSLTDSTLTRPTPRTSIWPSILRGAAASSLPLTRRTTVLSSLTRTAPRSMRRSARSDFPAPDRPAIRIARPSLATQETCSVSEERDGPVMRLPLESVSRNERPFARHDDPRPRSGHHDPR